MSGHQPCSRFWIACTTAMVANNEAIFGHLGRLILAALILIGLQAPVSAQQSGGNNIQVSLVPGAPQAPAGGSIPIAFVMKPKPTWHGYWKNPGDAGADATIEWTLPAGVTIGELRYPVPERLTISGIMNYVYE